MDGNADDKGDDVDRTSIPEVGHGLRLVGHQFPSRLFGDCREELSEDILEGDGIERE